MMIITFLNQKGGAGKTTVALLLACVLHRAGYSVSVDDQDPQGSAAFFAESFGLKVNGDPGGEEAFHVIVDTPPGLKQATTIYKSDRLILITEKTPHSIHASFPMARLIKESMKPGAQAYVLFNKVQRATVIGKQDSNQLAADFGLPALKHELPQASAYQRAFIEGYSAVTGQHRMLLLELALEILK